MEKTINFTPLDQLFHGKLTSEKVQAESAAPAALGLSNRRVICSQYSYPNMFVDVDKLIIFVTGSQSQNSSSGKPRSGVGTGTGEKDRRYSSG